jgi:prefoldin subunit 5
MNRIRFLTNDGEASDHDVLEEIFEEYRTEIQALEAEISELRLSMAALQERVTELEP